MDFQKKHVVFWGFLAHLEQKKILKFFTLKISQPSYLWTDVHDCWLSGLNFFPWTLFTPKFNSVNQQSDPVSSQLSFQFSYAGLRS